MKAILACLALLQSALLAAEPQIAVPPGFKVDVVRMAQPGEGSWVAMCKDNKGRLIISPQNADQPMVRVALNPDGTVDKFEKIAADVGQAMGLLYAFDALYVSGAGPEGLALYRVTDTNNDDQFDKVETLKKFSGMAGEHGSHALELGPDNRIYYLHGNFVKVPNDISPTSPHKNYADDMLLPRGEDGNGFGRGLKPPGGFILRGDKDGKNWEMIAAGMRNAYDFSFNADGEIFTFDSDMEWDWAMPWYRPTRIYHLVSGGEYGFREGTAKWPAYYYDGLPPTLDAGIGSPTGTTFGYGAKFPAKYQNALYAMDWSYGRIFAVHLKPHGATYSAEKEVFVKGRPLNVTDMVIGNDGAMYFITGGRNTKSTLYRVSYTGSESTAPAPATTGNAEARALRKKLEAFHGKKNPDAINVAWPHLNSPDRWIRYAARIAIESQDVSLWSERALQETSVDGGLTALLALARNGASDQLEPLMSSLDRIGKNRLTDEQRLAAVRLIQVSLSRMGRPNEELRTGLLQALDPLFPSDKADINRELAQILIYLNAPKIVDRTLALVQASPIFEDKMHYMFHLRTLKTGWTKEQRAEYFRWFNTKPASTKHPPELVAFFTEAGREYSAGASFPKFLANAKKDAFDSMSEADRAEFSTLFNPEAAKPAAAAAPKPATHDWKTADFAPLLEDLAKSPRDFKRGQQAYATAQCLACHKMREEGGSVGPDLTAISQRFTRRDLLESITEPSKVISDQYASTDITLTSGDELTGRIIEEAADKFVVLTNPLNNTKTEVKKSEIASRKTSKLSPMPEGLINALSKEEVLDLLAYMEAAGRDTHPLFNKRN